MFFIFVKRINTGPAWLPIVGNFVEFRRRLCIFGYHHLAWESFSRELGDVVGLKMGRNLVVTVFGPDAVKEVLTREEFDGRPDGYFFRLRTFGKRLGTLITNYTLPIFLLLSAHKIPNK